MSIIDQGENPGTQELTLEQKQERLKKQVARKSYETFQAMVGNYSEIKRMMWQNQQGLTPQQAFDALGTNAAELFQLSSVLVQAVNSVKPNTLDPAQPYEFTVNEDGTVTVGDPVATEDEEGGGA